MWYTVVGLSGEASCSHTLSAIIRSNMSELKDTVTILGSLNTAEYSHEMNDLPYDLRYVEVLNPQIDLPNLKSVLHTGRPLVKLFDL
jgi:hypothetical protein